MSKGSLLVVILTSLIFLGFFFKRGFAYFDEGFILHAAQRVVQGEIPYKDFDLIYTPGTIFLVAAVFKVLGESVVIGRILTMVVGLLTSFLIYFITLKISKNKLLSFLSMLIYLSWGPSHINFPWPTLFAFSSGLFATYILGLTMKGSFNSPSTRSGSLRMAQLSGVTLAGAMTFITFLFKQNFGFATLLAVSVSLALVRRYRWNRGLRAFVLGFILSGIIFLAYLVLGNSMTPFFKNFYSYSIVNILFQGAFATSFPVGVKSLFYLLPGFISLAAVFVAYKRQKKYIIFPLFSLFFFIFGIRPTTDYVHLTVLMATTGIPMAMFTPNLKNNIFPKYPRLIEINRNWLRLIVTYGLSITLVFIGFYTAIWKNYYRWDSPLVKQKYFISQPRAGIFVDQKFKQVIPEVVSGVLQSTKKSDYIFVFYNAPMFYFLTDRKNPTRYINFSPDFSLGKDREREVIKNLKEKKVNIIVTHERPQNWGNPLISKFIVDNFRKVKEVFEFTVWEKD